MVTLKTQHNLDVPHEYISVERWVYFSDNTLYSYSPFKEKLFRTKYDSSDLKYKLLLSRSDYIKVLLKYLPDQPFELTKDTREFNDVSSRVGLDSLYSITNPPIHYTSSEELD